MNIDNSMHLLRLSHLRRVVMAFAVGSIVVLYGCGGDSTHTGNATNEYPAGVSEDVEQQLKYDARVESFEPDGEDLIVNVNDSWATAPQGMQERAVGQWYSLWQAQHAGKVIVKYDGEAVATWSGEGYKPEKPKTTEDEEQVDSES